jgi:hypothetical protein
MLDYRRPWRKRPRRRLEPIDKGAPSLRETDHLTLPAASLLRKSKSLLDRHLEDYWMRGMPFLFAGVLLGYSIFCGEHGPAQVTDPTALPDVPAQLRVPAGNKLIFKAEAKGVQSTKVQRGRRTS